MRAHKGPWSRAPPKADPVDKVTSDLHGLRVEYLKDVLKPLEHFSVDLPRAGLDAEGRPMESFEKKHFQILSITHSQSRPELMPTIESHDDVSLRSRLALNIQEYSAMPGAGRCRGKCSRLPRSQPSMGGLERFGGFCNRQRNPASVSLGQGIRIESWVHHALRFGSCSSCARGDRHEVSSIGDAFCALPRGVATSPLKNSTCFARTWADGRQGSDEDEILLPSSHEVISMLTADDIHSIGSTDHVLSALIERRPGRSKSWAQGLLGDFEW